MNVVHADPRSAVARLPARPGVYRFRDARGRILYIGRATTLRRRVQSYWGDLRDRGHLRAMVARIARVEAIACDSVHEAAWLERNLLEVALPPWNRTPGGQETPVYLRVDLSASAPGLRLDHDAVPKAGSVCFGPYLGGMRAQQAISGLNRVAPLAYAGSRLSGAAREIAVARGVGHSDRERLSNTVLAVLRREPAAVASTRAALEELRDRAASALAFELAGRVRDEIAAIDWVTSVQRVTVDGTGEHEVCGWHGGIAVTLVVRDGRVAGWRQRRCSQRAATPAVAATPPEWTEFATDNAILAATLAGRDGA